MQEGLIINEFLNGGDYTDPADFVRCHISETGCSHNALPQNATS
jgi:hypothetical protein